MSYQIEIKRSAAKSLKKIIKADRVRIVEKIDSFAENLPNPETTKMKGGTILFTEFGLVIIGSFMKYKMISLSF